MGAGHGPAPQSVLPCSVAGAAAGGADGQRKRQQWLDPAALAGIQLRLLGASTAVHVDEGQDPASLEISLLPYPKLSGRVLHPERHPLAGIQVSVIPFRGLTMSPAVTDKEGRYEFKSLAPGEFAILANPFEARGSEFSPTYYPGAADRVGAERIAAKSGAELAGYDIVLRGGPFCKVSGRVLDGGRPAARAAVTVQTADAVYGTATADAGGAFEIERVSAGDLHVWARWKRGEMELRGFAPVAATKYDVENVTLRLSRQWC